MDAGTRMNSNRVRRWLIAHDLNDDWLAWAVGLFFTVGPLVGGG